MDYHNHRWDLETGLMPPPRILSGGISRHGNGSPVPSSGCQTPISTYYYTSDGGDKAEKQQQQQQQEQQSPPVHTHHPTKTQRELFLAIVGESLSVGFGLGSAVGIWACIHATLVKIPHGSNPHLANWVCGVLMGFFLAPLLEKASRVFFGRLGTVLAKPHPRHESVVTRFAEHFTTITTALVGVGIAKGVQMQYAPFHASLGCEYAVFVIGFTVHAFLRAVFYPLIISTNFEEYQAERVARNLSWTRIAAVIFWEYLDHFHHVYILLTVNIRDFLTFALYPYLLVQWIGWWKAVVDPQERWIWVAEMLNIGFFFCFFTVLKEGTYLLARPFWKEDLPRHCHHIM